MPETISFSFNAQVSGGPALAGSREIPVSGYEKLVVAVAKDTDSAELPLLPDGVAADLVIVVASPPAASVTYDAGKGPQGLDSPVLLLGDHVRLLGDPLPSLKFHNGSDANVVVEVFVGRTE